MICRLCQRDRELKRSHIIPEFVYQALYDSKHKFHVLSTQDKRPRPMEQKGFRERLLCGDCEQKLSVFENYARGVLISGVPITVQDNGSLLHISGIEYKKFKLFQLSILWRSSIASEPMFSRVQIGPHEDAIRKMILGETPGRILDYPCIIFGLTSREGVQAAFIDQPTKLHLNGHVAYRFIFAGFMWVFYISSHKPPPHVGKVAVNESGEMVIGRGALEDLLYLREFGAEAKNMGRMPISTE